MRIKLSSQQAHCLAEQFAKDIHGRVVEMHLWTTDHIFHTKQAPFITKSECNERRTGYKEVCAAVRSIKNPDDRRSFVHAIRYYFKKLRIEHRTDPKWQDHLARVREINKDRVPTAFLPAPKLAECV